MNEVEFVKFEQCMSCRSWTDELCVSCDLRQCGMHGKYCVVCEQAVCEKCYEEDKCCLVRPWGEKTERRLEDFYRNKLSCENGLHALESEAKYGKEHRREALRRTIARFVDTFDHEALSWCKPQSVRDFFPSITKYVENEESCETFVEFMDDVFLDSNTNFAYTFLNDEVKEELFSVMDASIRSNQDIQESLIREAMKLKELFQAMKKRGLLNWIVLNLKLVYSVGHFDAYDWIERNGIDVVNNEEHFKHFVHFSPPEILEYLMVEKGMTVEYMAKNKASFRHDFLEMIYRVKGMEGLQSIGPEKLLFDFETWKFLKSIGFKFDKISPKNVRVYPLVCFKVLNYEDLKDGEKKEFDRYVRNYDIKASKHMYRFMKEIRKRKVMTVILCIRKTYPRFQKEIIWNILDYAYSPINERGSL